MWLHVTPCASGQPYQRPTIAGTLGILRRFLQTLDEWGWPDAPARTLVFAGDRPVLDEPLPRFLDAASEHRAGAAHGACGDDAECLTGCKGLQPVAPEDEV
jgi:hypothetical protein